MTIHKQEHLETHLEPLDGTSDQKRSTKGATNYLLKNQAQKESIMW